MVFATGSIHPIIRLINDRLEPSSTKRRTSRLEQIDYARKALFTEKLTSHCNNDVQIASVFGGAKSPRIEPTIKMVKHLKSSSVRFKN